LESSVKRLREDPVFFAEKFFGFKATDYQAKLLRDQSKRIVVRMSRQAGKTTTIAIRAIWFAITKPRTLTLIVSPSLRQSMIMMDRVQEFLARIPESLRKRIILKQQRTVVRFRNQSMIVALPNSPQLLRGYTAHKVICDEAAFFRDDELVFYNVLYPMLATTDGWLIVLSTPWGKNSVFYRMCQDPNFSKHIVSWRDVVKAGLIKQDFIEEMRRQLPSERFQREFEAQFIEEANAYFPQDLIVSCIDSELEYYKFEDYPQGDFYIGVDFGKKHDYSVVAVVEKREEKTVLIHLYRFKLDEPYSSVIGYIKAICDRYKSVNAVLCDQTGVGEYIVEDMQKVIGAKVQGIVLTMQAKEEILGYLKQKMQNKLITFPYDPDLINEINVENFELTKDGHVKFSHAENTHDDRLWAFALAVYASRKQEAPRLIVLPRR
jgi:phage FluMu gp28-like protein